MIIFESYFIDSDKGIYENWLYFLDKILFEFP